jgi:hypothetical protein
MKRKIIAHDGIATLCELDRVISRAASEVEQDAALGNS